MNNIKHTVLENGVIERTIEKEKVINGITFNFTLILSFWHQNHEKYYKSEEDIVLENIDNIIFKEEKDVDLSNSIVKIAIGNKDSIFTEREVIDISCKGYAVEKYLERLSSGEDVDIFYVIGENGKYFYYKTDYEIVKNLRKLIK